MKNLLDEEELIARLHRGDVEAFDQLYNYYSPKLYSFALRYLKSDAEAEELVQSVFIKIWENHKNLKKELSFRSYIFTISYNEICKIFRKRYYSKRFIDYAQNQNSKQSQITQDQVNYQNFVNIIHELIEELPDKHRSIFIKSRFEGKSTKDISKELHLSPGTVDNYISKVIAFLKHRIQKLNLDMLPFIFLALFIS